jgi:hypothetical protein
MKRPRVRNEKAQGKEWKMWRAGMKKFQGKEWNIWRAGMTKFQHLQYDPYKKTDHMS